MSQVTLRINNVLLPIDSSLIPDTSKTTKNIFEQHAPQGVLFPQVDDDCEIAGLTLKEAVDKLEAMGPHIGRLKKLVATIVAVAGVVLLGVAAFTAFAGNMQLAVGSLVLGFPLLGIGYGMLHKEKLRQPVRQAVEDIFSRVMDFYVRHGDKIRAALEKEVEDLEASLASLATRDVQQWRRECIMPAVTNKQRAFVELNDNLAYYREKKQLIRA